GDELNRIEPGRNYGWPIVTSGKMYPSTANPRPGSSPAGSARAGSAPAADEPTPAQPGAHEGMEPPIVQWTPTIAPSGIAFYTGTGFPAWTNNLFVTALAGEALRRLETDGDKVVHEEVIFKGFGRVRDVVVGPDGLLYVALNTPGVRLSDTTPGMIIRLVP